jgi:putative membrane protein
LPQALGEIDGGATTLEKGSRALPSGAHTLEAGISTLHGKMPESISIPLGDPKGIAQGVMLVEEKTEALSSNGSAFAPYFIGIDLWIGALLTTFLFPYRFISHSVSATSQTARIAAKLVPGLRIVSCQALVMIPGIQLLGVRFLHILPAVAICLLSSWSFLALIVAFMLLVADAGKLLALVLLIIQAASAGSTFPVEFSAPFYRVCHAILPISSTLDGLRFAISGSYDGMFSILVLKLCLTILFAVILMALGRRKWITVEDWNFASPVSW